MDSAVQMLILLPRLSPRLLCFVIPRNAALALRAGTDPEGSHDKLWKFHLPERSPDEADA
jgi:hypothetical protein